MQIQTPILHSEILRFKTQFKDVSRIVVAYSGGLDSTVLLHLLASDPELQSNLYAIYIDHQLQTESSQWSDHCAALCLDWNVAFKSIKVEIETQSRQGLESNARKARYQALHSNLSTGNILLTGHHQRDQSETFLLNLQRGSGVAGLAAMPYQKNIALASDGFAKHVRPLLYVPYTELVEYALANQLQWIEDSSNMDLNFSRNQVRHQLLPAFEQACSNIQQQIQRSALHQSEALQLLKRLAQQDLNSGVYSELYIDLDSYRVLDWPSLKNVLRFWAEDQFKLRLGYDQLEWIKRYSRDNPSASASLKLSQGQLRFYRTKLYYVTDNKNDYQLKLDEVQPCSISASDIRAKRDFRVLLPLDWYEANRTKLTLRNIKHADHGNSKRLKKWFQQQGVPVWERLHWPVLYMNDLPLTLWGAAGIFENNVSTQLEKLISERQESHEFICFHLTESEIVSLSSELK